LLARSASTPLSADMSTVSATDSAAPAARPRARRAAADSQARVAAPWPPVLPRQRTMVR
jgi:hypothetical protein